MKTTLFLAFLGLSGFATAQTDHFPQLKWKEKELDHFLIRTHGSSDDPARKFSERTYKEMVAILPGLAADMEKKEFRTPGGQEASRGDRFRVAAYLVDSVDDFNILVEAAAKEGNWPAGNVQITRQVGNFLDPQNRYLVICKTDTTSSNGGAESDRKELLVHQIGSLLTSARSRQGDLPFWMTAGMGYYCEHRVFDRCVVHYLDFQQYYKDNPDAQVDAQKGGALGNEDSWAKILRKLCKADVRVSLERVLNAKVITLSPNESGYIFALNYFLVSTDELAKKYQAFHAALRDGKEPSKELLLETYGYNDDASFEKDWYEFVMSSKFK